MDWTERINSAVAYVEANLEGEIEMGRLTRLAGCSAYNFQRLFAYIADKSLAQYIRERRLTLAAFDVVRTDARIIDIALRYGYESQDAFARAFRQYHGVLPSVARREPVTLKSCPRIVFHINTKGAMTMNYRVEQWPAFTVAGFKIPMRTEEAFAKVPGIWKDAWTDGRIKRLHQLFADYRPEGFLGIGAGGQWGGSEMMDYYLAVTTWVDRPDAPKVETPKDLDELTLPAATWVIVEANGNPNEVIQPMYKALYTQWLPSSGYTLADLPVIECYMQDGRQTIWLGVDKA